MRQLIPIFCLIFLLIPLAGNAQKASLNEAEAIIMRGENGEITPKDIEVLSETIQSATSHPTLQKEARTWYVNAMAHYLLYQREQIIKTDAIQQIALSLDRTQQLSPRGKKYHSLAQLKRSNIYYDLLNSGVQAYNDAQQEEAMFNFESAATIMPTDTSASLYAATVAAEDKQYARAVRNYQKLAKINPSSSLYNNIILLQKNYLQDLEAALATLQLAEQQFPKDPTLERNAVDLFIQTGQLQRAIQKLNGLISVEPTNHLFHLRKALLYDQLYAEAKNKGKTEELETYQKEAESAYLRTLEIDPDNMTANFNYAVQIAQRADEFFGAANELPLDEYKTRGKELEERGLALLVKAVEPMETARKAAPKDPDLLRALETMYSKLGIKDKWQEVREILKELGY
jgi:tetratricopeptide (TPR) repeat protein